MPTINPVKGTHDIIADEADVYSYIESVFAKEAESFGYRHIVTPVLEHTEVFDRATGEGSDVVRKEMYTFLDKAERSVTLRPEGTAGVMRSIMTNKLYATPDMPLKYYYSGTTYRYERPQLGRYREFRQIGVECVGEDSVYLDAETVALAARTLQKLGFKDLRLKINTLGDKASRENYKEALRAFFATRIDQMCPDCHERLRLNPLRILDCKVPEDHALVADAPKMKDYLSPESLERYQKTLDLLRLLDIPFEEDDTLVRGLDYYGEIVFEVHCISPEGNDYGAICGGGHYEGILTNFGGPKEIDV
ncbi:MAG: histidine--tRNA ligase, partial [Bacilli bacterium]|nr:histidine--tRNA ligase [Bacilli bacterium]